MSEAPKIRAARYLRMSTEHQRYSLTNQAEAIGAYAVGHGYEIIRSYVDPARSGLTLEDRPGLHGRARGRPVSVTYDPAGGILLIADDLSSTVWQVVPAR